MKKLISFVILCVCVGIMVSCASTSETPMEPYSGVWRSVESAEEDYLFVQMEIGTKGKAIVGLYDSIAKVYRSQADMTYEFDDLSGAIIFTDVRDLSRTPFDQDVLPGEFAFAESGDLTLSLQDGEREVVLRFVKKFRKDMTDREIVVDKLISSAKFDMDSAYILQSTGGKIFGIHAMSNYVNIESATDTRSLLRDLAPQGILYRYGSTEFWIKADGRSVEYTLDGKVHKGMLIPLEDYLEENPVPFYENI